MKWLGRSAKVEPESKGEPFNYEAWLADFMTRNAHKRLRQLAIAAYAELPQPRGVEHEWACGKHPFPGLDQIKFETEVIEEQRFQRRDRDVTREYRPRFTVDGLLLSMGHWNDFICLSDELYFLRLWTSCRHCGEIDASGPIYGIAMLGYVMAHPLEHSPCKVLAIRQQQMNFTIGLHIILGHDNFDLPEQRS